MLKSIVPAAACLLICCAWAGGQSRIFPADAVVDVTRYGALPDDGRDDTAALQRAISAHVGSGVWLYFPDGVYNLSDSLRWRTAEGRWEAHLGFHGQSRQGVILRLADSADGFGDPARPRAMLVTASHWNEGDGDDGGGNKAYRNNLFNLTLDTGSGNDGAIGVEWANSNWGAIKGVSIRSGDGAGVAGIAMKRSIPGPGLIEQVSIDGFDVGIDTADIQYGLTLEHIDLTGQRVAGVRTTGNLLHIHRLRSRSAVPGVVVTDKRGALVLLASELAQPPVVHGTIMPPDLPRTLAIEQSPNWWNDNPNDWHGIGPRRPGEADDTAAIQRALDSGASTIYFPIGRTYFISDTLIVRGGVRQVLGMGAEISLGAAEAPFADSDHPRPLIRIDPTNHDTVFLEHLFFNAQYPGAILFENNTPATVVIRHSGGWVGAQRHRRSYRNTAAATSKVFIEDVFLPGWSFVNQTVFARQFNPENHHNTDGRQPQVLNDGGRLWILGFKTEGQAPFIVTRNGGVTEVLGAYHYISATAGDAVPADAVPYVFEDSTGTLSFIADNFRDSDYRIYIRRRHGQRLTEVPRSALPARPGLHRSTVLTGWSTAGP